MENYLGEFLKKQSPVEGGADELLFESQALNGIKRCFENSPKDFAAQAEAASRVGQLIRQTVRFSSTNSNTPLLRPEMLAENPIANCIGHTILSSECLEKVGIDHYIVFMNDHAVLIVPDTDNQNAFLLDAVVEGFCVETAGFADLRGVDRRLTSGELFADTTFDSLKFMGEQTTRAPIDTLIDKHPWMSFSSEEKLLRDENTARDFTLKARIYPSIPGRMLLQKYYDADIYCQQDELELMTQAITELDGVWPETDSRNYRMELARTAIKSLIAQEHYQQAIKVAEVFDSSLSPGDGSNNGVVLGDTLRKIANITRDESMAKLALETYENSSTNDKLLRGKIRAAKSLVERLGGEV